LKLTKFERLARQRFGKHARFGVRTAERKNDVCGLTMRDREVYAMPDSPYSGRQD
jgi:hypothetical protein